MQKYYLFLILLTLFCCSKPKASKNNTYYNQAKGFLTTKNSDSAFFYFNIAKNEYLKKNDSLGVAKSLVNMAIIQSDKGDFFGGIETSLEANKFLKQDKDSIVRSTLASNYNSLAISAHFLKDYDAALDYYVKALKYSTDSANKRVYYNNIGDVLITMGKYKSAKKYLEKAIQTKDSVKYARALNNLAKAQYLDDKNYNPLPEFYKALQIRSKNEDSREKNSSFETLAAYFAKKDPNLSLHFAKSMFEEARAIKSPDDQIIALQKIIPLDSENFIKNFHLLNSINDSLQTARNKDKKQFAIVRYNIEAKNTENQILKSKNFKKNIGLAILVLSIIIGVFWFKKRKKRQQQEKELEIKNTELKYSKKVHDVVANGIYQVMTKIENQENFSKENALDELELVYEKSRDISYEKTDGEKENNFNEKISALIASFKNENLQTYIAGNDAVIWKNLSPSSEQNVYQIIREIMVNMKKHSHADRVVFKFERMDQLIKIQYSDNGIGISKAVIFKNGHRNMVSRIENIHGQIIFDTETEKGLKINISLPVS